MRVERVFPIRILPKRKVGLKSSESMVLLGLLWQLANKTKQSLLLKRALRRRTIPKVLLSLKQTARRSRLHLSQYLCIEKSPILLMRSHSMALLQSRPLRLLAQHRPREDVLFLTRSVITLVTTNLLSLKLLRARRCFGVRMSRESKCYSYVC